jgi:hypothetical protein
VGDFDIDTLEFGDSPGQVFHLPRDNHCERIYCNVEGIQWIGEADEVQDWGQGRLG